MVDSCEHHCILVLDFGGQYAQLLARTVRELGVYCLVLPYDSPPEALLDVEPKGVILSGGPESTQALDAPKIPSVVWRMRCPVLGICYGMQAMATVFDGQVSASDQGEYGHTVLDVVSHSWLADVMHTGGPVWMSHQDYISACPKEFEVVAHTANCPIAAFAHQTEPYYGVQFHPEVTHTVDGVALLKHFLYSICLCDGRWTFDVVVDERIEAIREAVGSERVVLGLSGGVDSAVAATLIHRAIGDQMIAIFVDNGLLRDQEAEAVEALFKAHMGIKLVTVNAQTQFLKALEGVSAPEQKRKIIGREFVHVFQLEAEKLEGVRWLAQGTIYPDVIESAGVASGKSHVIKSHHNVGGLPETLSLKLLEPLRDLFKDEVRKLGEVLGLPGDLLNRHPFPGPGLAVRVMGVLKPDYLRIVREADAIFIAELKAQNWYHRVAQALVVFLPVKTVGVVGDQRAYGYVLALRAVETTDFMTATAAHLPEGLVQTVSTRIINEVAGVARVVYDVSSKPPATIEWE